MKKQKGILITKASGEKALFDEDKLRHSLSKAGAEDFQINEIISELVKSYTMAFPLNEFITSHLIA